MSDWLEAERLAEQATELFESGKAAEAAEALRAAITIDGCRVEWHWQLGLVLQAMLKLPEAAASFDEASRLEPDAVQLVHAAAIAHARAGSLTAAATRMDEAVRLAPGDASLWAQLIEFQAATGDHEEAAATFYLAEWHLGTPSACCLAAIAGSLMCLGQMARAEWCLTEAIRLDEDLGIARRRFAELLAATGRADEAAGLFKQLVMEAPDDGDVAVAWARLLLGQGLADEAEDVLEKAIEAAPANAAAHFQLGLIAMRAGHLHQAALTFQIVRLFDRAHLACDVALAACLLGLGQGGDARRLLGSAVIRMQTQEAPLGPDLHVVEFGGLLLSAGMPHEAAEVLSRALDGGVAVETETLRLLARARLIAGDLSGGCRVSRRILRTEPDCVASLSNLALAAMVQGRLRVAAGWIAKAIASHPQDRAVRALRWRWAIRCIVVGIGRLAGR